VYGTIFLQDTKVKMKEHQPGFDSSSFSISLWKISSNLKRITLECVAVIQIS
jgi:hypothetical protein